MASGDRTYIADKVTLDEVKALISEVSTTPKVVKSIQRGTGSGSGDITISSVNPSKCAVFLEPNISAAMASGSSYGSEETYYAPQVSSLTATKLTISGAYRVYEGTDINTYDSSFSWQIIEFY